MIFSSNFLYCFSIECDKVSFVDIRQLFSMDFWVLKMSLRSSYVGLLVLNKVEWFIWFCCCWELFP